MKKPKTYQFTLILKNIDENTLELEDSLYEAGCDDALIHFKNRTVYLEFNRKASSLEAAVISAIRNVQSSTIEAEVSSIAPENYVTESEIAKRLKISRQLVSLWIKGKRRKSFPHPVMCLTEKSQLWKWSDICVWLYDNKLIKNQDIIEHALFFANINAALEERDKKTRKMRQHLLEKLLMHRL